jgi:FkbH-like protein
MDALPNAQEISARRRRGAELQRRGAEPQTRRRMAVLSSFNLDLLPPFLVESLDRFGLDFEVTTGDFGQIAAQALDPGSDLFSSRPDAVLVAPAVEDLLAPLFAPDGEVLAEEEVDRLVDDRLAELRDVVLSLRQRLPQATCYFVVFGPSRAPAGHVLAPRDPRRGQAPVERMLEGLRSFGELGQQVVVVDWDWLLRRHGAAAFEDRRLWYLGRMRLGQAGLAALAELVARHVRAFHGPARKLLAVDLDDTLWGGIVGEDGLSGIALGDEGVGLAFQDFQREMLRLRANGVLLALCSKNNPEDVAEVFGRHPGMVLRREHFAAERINWQSKDANLRELGEELGLGLDSFVFVDDNPVERDWVRQALPEVAVPELPEDPVDRPAFLASVPFFDQIGITDADLKRAASYQSQGERHRLHERTGSFEEFLASLEQEVVIAPVDEATIGRAAQLCQRTNQFNLTTRRHTLAELERMLADPDRELITVAVRDRYGDSGITGLAILDFAGPRAEIETLLLSCRVLGRRIEDAVLSVACEHARARGARTLAGRYVPSPRNMQAARLYPERGFAETPEEGVFELDLEAEDVAAPSQIKVIEPLRA